MIQNKKLFIITLLSGLLVCAAIDVPLIVMQKNTILFFNAGIIPYWQRCIWRNNI